MNYFETGVTVDNKYINSSCLKKINPEEGGSPRAFLKAFEEKEEETESAGLNNGKLIHRYMENPNKFIVAEFNMPTEMMTSLLDNMLIAVSDIKNGSFKHVDIDIALTSKQKGEKAQTEIATLEFNFSKLAEILKVDRDNAIRAFRKGRILSKAYSTTGDAVISRDVIEGINERAYIDFFHKKENKIVLNAKDKERVTGAITSISNHPQVSHLLGLNNEEDDLGEVVKDPNVFIYKEVPCFWKQSVKIMGTDDGEGNTHELRMKSLLDHLIIDHNKKTIIYNDLKSTGDSIYKFQHSFEMYRYYRQMGFYQRAIKELFVLNFPDKDIREYRLAINLIPVETFGYFNTCIYPVSQKWLYKGAEEAKLLLSRIAYHEVTGYGVSFEEIINKGILYFKEPT